VKNKAEESRPIKIPMIVPKIEVISKSSKVVTISKILIKDIIISLS
jgi:hypothetical protein